MNNNIFKRISLALTATLATLTATAAIPEGYYNSLDGLSGQALKNAIHQLTRQHTVFSYSSLWYYFRTTDCHSDDSTRVWDMYSDNVYHFGGNYVWGMNKEHSFPKSWWGGSTSVPSYTDINHLYPSDAEANSAKLNWPLGEVSTTTFDNGVSRVGTPVAGQGGGASSVFEPDDRYKGDFARTYFYMVCCYQDLDWAYHYMLTDASWLTLTPWASELLCKWARQDAVSDKETDRNNAVQQCQNNRNPFIDFPDLFEYIWGDRQGQVFHIDNSGATTGDPMLISPTQGTVLDFGEVAIGKSIDYTVYVKGSNLNTNLSLLIYKYDTDMFSIPATSIDRVAANSAGGYALTITYTPTAVGDHQSRLLISDGGLTGSYGAELRARCVEVPRLTAPRAETPDSITDSTFVARWQPAPEGETVDYYIVTVHVYDEARNLLDSYSVTTDDGNQTQLEITGRDKHLLYTYYVQSYRLGYTSEPSNTISVDQTGLSGPQARKPMIVLPMPGGVVVKCDEPLGPGWVCDLTGRVVTRLANVDNDTRILLPRGIYILTTANHQAVKIAVSD